MVYDRQPALPFAGARSPFVTCLYSSRRAASIKLQTAGRSSPPAHTVRYTKEASVIRNANLSAARSLAHSPVVEFGAPPAQPQPPPPPSPPPSPPPKPQRRSFPVISCKLSLNNLILTPPVDRVRRPVTSLSGRVGGNYRPNHDGHRERRLLACIDAVDCGHNSGWQQQQRQQQQQQFRAEQH